MSQRLVQFKAKGSGLQIPVYPALPPWLAMSQGNVYFVHPFKGNDQGNDGSTPDKALRTVARAHALMTANQNDICFLLAGSNTSATTTNYQSTMLNWSKDLCHLVGVNCGVSINPRSRIAQVSTWTSADPLMTLSADGCYIAGLSLWSGVADVTTLGCLKITGQRNLIERCHIIGMGVATNDITGAYSVLLSGAAENEIRGCTIGSEIVALGAAANSQILTAAGCFGNKFVDSDIVLNSAHATNTVFYRVPTTTMLGSLSFINCRGRNGAAAPGPLTYAGVTHASAGGNVIVDATSSFQATDLDSNTTNVYVATLGANSTSGLLVLRA